MIRILLVDDQTLLCEVLKTWLEVEEDFQVVGVAHNGEQALGQVEILQPDLVLMDIDMPGMNGINATKIICERYPQIKVIFLSGHDDDSYLGKSLKAGAKGYLLKNTTAEELAQKIRSVYHDETSSLFPNNDYVVALKAQLEELMEIYRDKFEKQLETELSRSSKIIDLESLGELENLLLEKYDHRLVQLESINGNTWESIRSEILELQTQMSEANHNLSSQMNQQIVNLKKELDTQLANALEDWFHQRAVLQEWAVQRDEMRPSLEEFENKYSNQLMSVINPIKASFRDVDAQIRMLRNGVIATIIAAAMSLSLASWVFIANLNNNNPSSANPTQVK